MKNKYTYAFILSLSLLAGCSSPKSSDAAKATPPDVPQAKVESELSKSTKTSMTFACHTINFLQGGGDADNRDSQVTVTSEDDHKKTILSANSRVEISLQSHHGLIQLIARDVQFGYIRGKVETPSSTPFVTLSPNNDFFNHGYSWANCTAGEGNIVDDVSESEWSCSAQGYTTDKGDSPARDKTIKLTAFDENLVTPIFENQNIRIEASSFHGGLTLQTINKKLGNSQTSAHINWSKTNSVTLVEPHYMMEQMDDLFPEKVTCTKK